MVLIGFREPYVPGEQGVVKQTSLLAIKTHLYQKYPSFYSVINTQRDSFFFWLFHKTSSPSHKQTVSMQQWCSPLNLRGPTYPCVNTSCEGCRRWAAGPCVMDTDIITILSHFGGVACPRGGNARLPITVPVRQPN